MNKTDKIYKVQDHSLSERGVTDCHRRYGVAVMNDNLGHQEDVPVRFREMRAKAFKYLFNTMMAGGLAALVWIGVSRWIPGMSLPLQAAGIFLILGATYAVGRRIDRMVVCPSCANSLVEAGGWRVFEGRCPHCHCRYRN